MRIRSLIAPTVAVLLIASAAHAAFWEWSKTSASNATADPTINWAEGMSPSSVNDSARAMMARAAEYRDDISGLLTTGGTSTAYTVATNQGLDAVPNDGQMLAITVHATNGAAVTLTADSGTTYPIQTSPGVAVASGTLIAGSPYRVKFSLSDSAWVLFGFYGNPFTIPVGGLIPYTGSTVPNSNFVFPAGQCISRTTYAEYFAQVSTTYGTCDGTTTFGVPDLRGRTIAAIDNLGGSAANRLTSTYFGSSAAVIGNTGGSQSHTLTAAESAVLSYTSTVTDPGHTHNENRTFGGPPGVGISQDSTIGASSSAISTGLSFTGITVATSANAGGAAHSIVPPTIVLSYILRVI